MVDICFVFSVRISNIYALCEAYPHCAVEVASRAHGAVQAFHQPEAARGKTPDRWCCQHDHGQRGQVCGFCRALVCMRHALHSIVRGWACFKLHTCSTRVQKLVLPFGIIQRHLENLCCNIALTCDALCLMSPSHDLNPGVGSRARRAPGMYSRFR